MSRPTQSVKRRFRSVRNAVVIHLLSLAATLTLVYFVTDLIAQNLLPITSGSGDRPGPTLLISLVLGSVLLNAILVQLALNRTGFLRSSSNDDNRRKRGSRLIKEGSLLVRPAALDASEKARAVRLLKLTRSAERLNQVEQDLFRKIGRDLKTDRETDELVCEVRICTNRVLAQVTEMRQVSYRQLQEDTGH